MPTILVADDNADSRLIYGTFFEVAGYRVLEAADGAAAVALSQTERPDVVLLNLVMPGMNGHEVLECLRTEPATSEIPCLMVTGDARWEQMGRALSRGADAFVTKPAAPREILELVRQILEEGSASATPG